MINPTYSNSCNLLMCLFDQGSHCLIRSSVLGKFNWQYID